MILIYIFNKKRFNELSSYASLACLFSAPDLPILSDPAKSTKFNFPTLIKS